jgi:hypothetical protein
MHRHVGIIVVCLLLSMSIVFACQNGQQSTVELPIPAAYVGQYLAKCIGFVFTPAEQLTINRIGITSLVTTGGDTSAVCSFLNIDSQATVSTFTVADITGLPHDDKMFYYDMSTSVVLNAGTRYLTCCYLNSLIANMQTDKTLSSKIASIGATKHSSSGTDFPSFTINSDNVYYNMMPVLSTTCSDCPSGTFTDFTHATCTNSFCNATSGCVHGTCIGVNSCNCSAGYYGTKCDTACPTGCATCLSASNCTSCNNSYVQKGGSCVQITSQVASNCSLGEKYVPEFPIPAVYGGQTLAKCVGFVYTPIQQLIIKRFGITSLVITGGDTATTCKYFNVDTQSTIASFTVSNILALPRDSFFFYYDMETSVTLSIGVKYLSCCYLGSSIANLQLLSTASDRIQSVGYSQHSSSGTGYPSFIVSNSNAYYNMMPVLSSTCDTCKSGQFSDSANLGCAASSCNSTNGCVSGTCTGVNTCRCNNGYYGTTCSNKCPDGCYNCTSSSQCLACTSGYSLINGLCIVPCQGGCGNGTCVGATCICNNGFYGSTCNSKCPSTCTICSSETNCTSCTSGSFLKDFQCKNIIAQNNQVCSRGEKYSPEFPVPPFAGGQYLGKCVGVVFTPGQQLVVSRFGITGLVTTGGDTDTVCSFFNLNTQTALVTYTVTNVTKLPKDSNFFYYDMPNTITLDAGKRYLGCCYLNSMITVLQAGKASSNRLMSIENSQHSSSGTGFPSYIINSENTFYNMLPVLSSSCFPCDSNQYSDAAALDCAASFCNTTSGCNNGACIGVNKCNCSSGYYESNCSKKCPTGCTLCTSNSICTACDTGYQMVNSLCVNPCGGGCGNGTCINNKCVCNVGYYGTNCESSCPIGCYECTRSYNCSSCSGSYYLKDGICKKVVPQVTNICKPGDKYVPEFPIPAFNGGQFLAKCTGFVYKPAQQLTISSFGITSLVTTGGDTSTYCSFFNVDTKATIATYSVTNITQLPTDGAFFYYNMSSSITLLPTTRYLSCCYLNSMIAVSQPITITSDKILSIEIPGFHSSSGTDYPSFSIPNVNHNAYFNMMPVLSSSCQTCPTGQFSDSATLGCASSYCNSTSGCGAGACVGVNQCSCQQGYFGVGCNSPCTPYCTSCSSGSTCVSCQQGYTLRNNTCVKPCVSGCGSGTCVNFACMCNTGFYGSECQNQCPVGCSSCYSNSNCSLCTSGYYLKKSQEGSICKKITSQSFSNCTMGQRYIPDLPISIVGAGQYLAKCAGFVYTPAQDLTVSRFGIITLVSTDMNALCSFFNADTKETIASYNVINITQLPRDSNLYYYDMPTSITLKTGTRYLSCCYLNSMITGLQPNAVSSDKIASIGASQHSSSGVAFPSYVIDNGVSYYNMLIVLSSTCQNCPVGQFTDSTTLDCTNSFCNATYGCGSGVCAGVNKCNCSMGSFGSTCNSICPAGCISCNEKNCTSCTSSYYLKNGVCVKITPQVMNTCTPGNKYVPEFPVTASLSGQYLAKCVGFPYTPAQRLIITRFGITSLVLTGGDSSTTCRFYNADTKEVISSYSVTNITSLPKDAYFYYYNVAVPVVLEYGKRYLSCCYLDSLIAAMQPSPVSSDRIISFEASVHSSLGTNYPSIPVNSNNLYYNMMPVISSTCQSCPAGQYSGSSSLDCAMSFCNTTSGCGNGVCTDINKCNCTSGYFGSTCSQTCPTTCTSCSSNSVCTTCIPGYSLQNDKCVKPCDGGCGNGTCLNFQCACNNGYYGSRCESLCQFGCTVCTGAKNCSSCTSEYYLKKNSCIKILPQVMNTCALGEQYAPQFPIIAKSPGGQYLAKCVGFVYKPVQQLTVNRFAITAFVKEAGDTSTSCTFYNAETQASVASYNVPNITQLPRDTSYYYYDMNSPVTLEAGKRYISCCYLTSLIAASIPNPETTDRIISIENNQHSSLGTGFPSLVINIDSPVVYYNMLPVLSSTCLTCPSGQFSDSTALDCSDSFCNSTKGCNSGTCTGVNRCACNSGFFGQTCTSTTQVSCFGVLSTTNSICSGHGSCVATDKCNCYTDYIGTNCQTLKPNPCIAPNSTVECSGFGACESGICYCYTNPTNGYHTTTFCSQCASGYFGFNCKSWKPVNLTFTDDMSQLTSQTFTSLSISGCSSLIHPANIALFGVGSRCSITNSKLTITLGANAQVTIGKIVGLNVLAGETDSPLYSDVTILAPLNPLSPTARISTQSVVGYCTGIRLDGSQSTFPDGRPGSYAWTCKNGPNCNDINKLSLNSMIIDISSELILPDSSYTFGLFVTSTFGLSANSSATVYKSKQPVITATIPGEKVKQLTGGVNILFGTVLVQCSNTSTFNYTLKWEQTFGPTMKFTAIGNTVLVYRRETVNPPATVGFKFMVLDPTTNQVLAYDTVTINFYLLPLKLTRAGDKYIPYDSNTYWSYSAYDTDQSMQMLPENFTAQCLYNNGLSCDTYLTVGNRYVIINCPPQQRTPLQFTIIYTYTKGDRNIADISTVDIGPETGVRFVLGGYYAANKYISASAYVYTKEQGIFNWYLNNRRVYPMSFNGSVTGYMYSTSIMNLIADDIYGVPQTVRGEFINSIGSGSAEFSFTLPSPPRPGSIMINPTQGYDLDKFVFTAASWIDDSQPLTYTWMVLYNGTIISYGPLSDSNQFTTYLPARPGPLFVQLTVFNRLGAMTTMTSQVTVQSKPNMTDSERLSTLSAMFDQSSSQGMAGPGFLSSFSQIGGLIAPRMAARSLMETDPSELFVSKLVNTLNGYCDNVNTDMRDQSYFDQVSMNVYNMLSTGYANSASQVTLLNTIDTLVTQSQNTTSTVEYTSSLYSPLLGSLDTLLSLGTTNNTKSIIASIIKGAADDMSLGDSFKYEGKEMSTITAKLAPAQLTNYDTSIVTQKVEVTLLSTLADQLLSQTTLVSLKVNLYPKERISWIKEYIESEDSRLVSPVIEHTVTDESNTPLNISTKVAVIRFKYSPTSSRAIHTQAYTHRYLCKQLDNNGNWNHTTCTTTTSSDNKVQCECSKLTAIVVSYDSVPVVSSSSVAEPYIHSSSDLGIILGVLFPVLFIIVLVVLVVLVIIVIARSNSSRRKVHDERMNLSDSKDLELSHIVASPQDHDSNQ